MLRKFYLKKNIFLLLFLISTTSSAVDSTNYKTYYNPRFHYSIQYPATFKISTKEAPNDSGQTFINQDEQVKLTIWGAMYPTNAKEGYQSEIEQDKGLTNYKITHNELKNNYYIIRGVNIKNHNNFYMKSIYSHKGNINLYIEYPSTEKNQWDQIVAHIADSLKYNNM